MTITRSRSNVITSSASSTYSRSFQYSQSAKSNNYSTGSQSIEFNKHSRINDEPTANDKLLNGMEHKTHPTIYVVFVSLLIDLLAFTMILPLLPSLLDYYSQNDEPGGLYPGILEKVRYFQNLVGVPDKFNTVLFGGFLGSMFSFLQFVASPLVGGISDAYGRKPVLIVCLVGIACSYVLWAMSRSFALFVLARIVGGISKGNVSLSMAIVTDVSSSATRGVGMALVGIAFSIGFIVGPVIGALFAWWARSQTGQWFLFPALFAFALSVSDLAFVVLCFNETLPKEKRSHSVATSLSQAASYISIPALFRFTPVTGLKSHDVKELRLLGLVYFTYLFLYSGLEFTLTFLTHHVFAYTSMQQGWMFFGLGLTMAVLQGSWIRRLPLHNAKRTATHGLLLIVPSFACVGLSELISHWLLYFGLFLFAVSTAMVVPCLMTLASQFGTAGQKGRVLGIFRSLGALARAFGPIVASIAYWSVGSSTTYCIGAVALLWPWYTLHRTL